jgi:copper chaperone
MTENRVLRVPDMSCGHCEMSVQEALDELDGVERSKADHTTGEVKLTYDANRVTDEKLSEAIEEAGYTLQRQA